MADLATVADVQALWRTLTTEEGSRAEALLRRASAVVRVQVPTVDARIANNTLSADVVSGVVVEMVLRVLDPDRRITARQVEDYSERYSDAGRTATAGIGLTPDELALLSPQGGAVGAYTVDMGTPYSTTAAWS